MSNSDDSWLSGYLDGELDPRQMEEVEREILANPDLAESLESLRSVRGLVSGLSRPVPPDLSAAVLERLEATPRSSGFWSQRRRHRWTAATVTAAAAAILLLVAPSLLRPRSEAEKPVVIQSAATSKLPSREGPSVNDPGRSFDALKAGNPVSLTAATSPHPSATQGTLPAQPALALNNDSLTESAESIRVRQLLDDPKLRRVFLVTDRLDQPLESKVTDAIKQSTRHEFYKVTVAHGIVVDPDHPGKATVLAVILDENELDIFRDRLSHKVSSPIQETEANPAITLQLADIGQIVSLPPQTAGDVFPATGNDLALRHDSRHEGQDDEQAVAPAVAVTGGIEREQSRPIQGSMAANGKATEEASRHPASKGDGQPKVALIAPSQTAAAHRRESSPVHEAIGSQSRSPNVQIGDRDRSSSDPKQCVVLVWITQPGRG